MKFSMDDKYLDELGLKVDEYKHDHFTKHYLSTEGYYFKYRSDKNDHKIIRATLYKPKDDSVVSDVRVSEGYGLPEKSHHDLINYFEVQLTLK